MEGDFDDSADELDGLPTVGGGHTFSSHDENEDDGVSEHGSVASRSIGSPVHSGSHHSQVSSPGGSGAGSPAGKGSGSEMASPPGSPVHSGGGSPSRERSFSPDGSAAGSPALSDQASPAGSHTSRRSRSGASGSPAHSGSASPRSVSGSPAAHSRSGSPAVQGHSRSATPVSRSPSGSPARSGSGSPARSGIGSPVRSRSASPARSGSGSGGRSRSGSPNWSGSGSPARSGSGSPARSRSGSPARSRSGSPARSRSGSPARSGSGSPARSRSGSPARSRSASPVRSGSGSPAHSGSASPARSAGSARSSESGQRKAQRRSRSGSGSGSDADEANAEDLFGDADDISSASSNEGDVNKERDENGMDVTTANQEEQEEEVPETRIEVEIPKINTNLGKQLHFVKLPNFLSVETRPFDTATYEDEIDEDEIMDEEGRTRLKLKVENTIRWKFATDENGAAKYDDLGVQVKESNARVVRWSDGSMSLHLGNEIFDVHVMQLQGDFNHLFVRQGTGLQGQAVFKTKLTFRPHSTDSFTHRKMTLSLADRSNKTQKVKVLPIAGKDPDAQRTEMIKKEEERLRASIRRESQQRRMRERAHQRGINASYLEGDYDNDDDNGVSLSAIKKQYKQGPKVSRTNIYSSNSEDEESEEEERNRKRLLKAKKLDSDKESDSDNDMQETKKKKAKVVSDSDEDEDL